MSRLRRPTALITVADFILPFALGVWAGWLAPAEFVGTNGSRVILTLFLGTGLAITALPVIAKILIDLGAIRRNVGITIMGAAMTEDLVGWTLLFVIVRLAEEGGLHVRTILEIGFGVGLFLVIAYFWGPPLLRFLVRRVDRHIRLEYATLTAIALFTFTYAATTQWLGIHAVFGAFLAGVTMARSPELRPQTRETIREFSLGILTPIFFCIVGLQVDFAAVENWRFFWIFLLLAVAGKVIGSLLGGTLGGLRWMESLTIGIGMNARGAMELVLAVVGFSQGADFARAVFDHRFACGDHVADDTTAHACVPGAIACHRRGAGAHGAGGRWRNHAMTRRFWERLRTIVSLQRDRFWFAREPRTVAPAQVAAPLPLAALLPPPAV